jgi:hypothetical protein
MLIWKRNKMNTKEYVQELYCTPLDKADFFKAEEGLAEILERMENEGVKKSRIDSFKQRGLARIRNYASKLMESGIERSASDAGVAYSRYKSKKISSMAALASIERALAILYLDGDKEGYNEIMDYKREIEAELKASKTPEHDTTAILS